jgi:hypothetical protein
MELTYLFTLLMLLFVACDSMGNERITYCSGTLKDIGNVVGSKPRIPNSLFGKLQDYGISRIRQRGCRGGKKRNSNSASIVDNSTSVFTNKDACAALDNEDGCQIPVIITNNHNSNKQVSHSRQSNLIHISLHSDSVQSSANSITVYLINARSVCNKAHDICDYIIDNDIDVLLITETWLSSSADVVLGELAPAGYQVLHVPRGRGRGGGGFCV